MSRKYGMCPCRLKDPDLREDFISRMRDLDFEKAIIVEDFGKRYGLK